MMAMTQCKECKQDVSTSAKACPHCGATFEPERAGVPVAGLLYLLLIGAFFYWIWGVMSPDPLEPTAPTSSAITTPPDAPPAVSVKALSLEDVRQGIDELITAGRFMEQYRHSSKTEDLHACGDMMRSSQAEARALRANIEVTPNLHHNYLTAASMAIRCVSCLPGAVSSCDEMDQLVGEAGGLSE